MFQENDIIEIDVLKEKTAALIGQKQLSNDVDVDIEPQKPLENPPETIKAIYSTSWSAGNPNKINYFINLIKSTELNAIVIDIKDFSGYIAYDIENSEVEKYGAQEIRIPKINKLIKQLHDEGIYVIARLTVFQDPVLAKARPDLAIHSRSKLSKINNSTMEQFSNETLWLDHKKLAWIDPASEEAWNYNIAVARDAASRGFDEINFDYIRFASDGNLDDMVFPFWNENTLKTTTIRKFFKHLRESLFDVKISADLFGLTTVNNHDMGIGQLIEDAYEYFDFVAPMVYPSHYAAGFIEYKNPAEYPYEVVKYSMESAVNRLTTYDQRLTTNIATSTESLVVGRKSLVKLRPWLQDFDLGADYDAEKVKAQVQAAYDAASSTPELINGWMLWNPSNVYTREALIY